MKTGVKIIKYLSDQWEPVPCADVAAAFETSYNTMMGYLVTLEDEGMVRRIGVHWELGTGLSLIWARKKSKLQSERDRINTLLSALGA